MKARFVLTLLLLSALIACTPTLPPPTPAATGTTLAERTSTPTPKAPTRTPRPTVSPVPTPSRTAAISLIENLVESRHSDAVDFSPASDGQFLPVGGQARTGEEGRARLDLAPDGTIIRLAPNTFFTLTKLEDEADNPFTLLELFFGKIYIILSGGELQVQTPSGVAAVRGSMLGVSYDPETKTMTATCLEGHCSLRNDKGVVDLVAGQAADIRDGVLSHGPRDITDQELFDWLEFAPELNNFPDLLAGLRDRINRLPKLPRRWPK